MNNYKLKHLSKFCCKPSDEFEFNLVKEHAEKGGVKFDLEYHRPEFFFYSLEYQEMDAAHSDHIENNFDKDCIISVLDFIKKLCMTEEEAEKLEDDRVEFNHWNDSNYDWSDDDKTLIAINGHYFKTNEDGTEVTLHKRD